MKPQQQHSKTQWVCTWGVLSLIARFMGPTCDPSGADRTQVGPMLAPWTLLCGYLTCEIYTCMHLPEVILIADGHRRKLQCCVVVDLDVDSNWIFQVGDDTVRNLEHKQPNPQANDQHPDYPINIEYRRTSIISRTTFQNLNVFRLVLQLFAQCIGTRC